jgi:hypothetical protein
VPPRTKPVGLRHLASFADRPFHGTQMTAGRFVGSAVVD